MNKIKGVIIVFLYFFGYHIANYMEPGNDEKYFEVRVMIYSIMIVLALSYKYSKNFVENIFVAIVLNNIIQLYFFSERWYTEHDIIIIPLIISLEYATIFRIYIYNYFRYLHDNFFNR